MSKVIAKDDVGAVRPWQMPNVASGDEADFEASDISAEANNDHEAEPHETTGAKAEGPVRSLLTLEQIEEIEQEAREEGRTAGYHEGIKEGRKRGYDEGIKLGRDEGYRRGFESGLEEGRQESQQRVQRLDQILATLATPLEQLDASVEEELLHLIATMTRQLLYRELRTQPEAILDAVRAAMKALPSHDRAMTVVLHPDDAALVQSHHDSEEPRPWQLREDATLTAGGCRVETDVSRVDASVERRLAAAINALWGEDRDHAHH